MINTGDTAFMLVATAMVMLMTPGLALFYGGLVRTKNVLGTMLQSFVCLGLVSLIWVLFGYSLAFGPDLGGFIGGLDYLGLAGVGTAPGPYSETIPHLLFCAFQLMFAVITPALISGAVAERMKFSSYLAFVALWSVLVYLPVCHWVWGGGWLGKMGALDFAGGTVIHLNSGAAALVAALVVGRRRNWRKEPFQPHNLPLTILGAGLLWFGWFGFNAGSALSAGESAALAFFNTQVATGTAVVTWLAGEWLRVGRPTILGAATGALAGLVAITPAAGFVSPLAALVIGGAAGLICYGAILLKEKLGYDDSLDVVGVHGVGGLWGALATGLLASVGGTGLLLGNPTQLWVQLLGAGAAMAYSFVLTYLILVAVRAVLGLRVSDEDEVQGLDPTQHQETGYNLT